MAFVRAIVRRLDLARESFPIVLGGSILQGGHVMLDERIARGIASVAPRARIVLPDAAPILGAAVAAALHAGMPPEAIAQARRALSGLVAPAAV